MLYKNCRNKFDKVYTREKRKFSRNKQEEIDRVNVDNPREFWKHIKSLGPQQKAHQIPLEVYCLDNQGHKVKTDDLNKVYKTWSDEFENLFNSTIDVKSELSRKILDELPKLELSVGNDTNNEINFPVCRSEVQRAVNR